MHHIFQLSLRHPTQGIRGGVEVRLVWSQSVCGQPHFMAGPDHTPQHVMAQAGSTTGTALLILVTSLSVVSHSRKVSRPCPCSDPICILLWHPSFTSFLVCGKWTSEPPPTKHERGVKSHGCSLVTSSGITLSNFVVQAAWHCPLPHIVLQSNGP